MHKSPQPKWCAPMLATLTYNPFSDEKWIYERKLDGMRCILYKKGDEVIIWSRNHVNQNKVFPELVLALKTYASDFILDSEVVAFEKTHDSFEKLQLRMHVKDPDPRLVRLVPITVFIFDILYLNDYDLTKLPLITRKEILKQNFNFTRPMRYLPHKVKTGVEYLAYATEHGWEGVIAKLAESTYVHKRSKDWLKFKCTHGQEFVVAGYTQPQGSRTNFGALLLGYYQNGKLKYAGRVGTGFNTNSLALIFAKMQPLEINACPFIDYEESTNNIHWLKPTLVAEVGFTEWTSEGRLRHPTFKGIRIDKKAITIKREYG